MARRSVAAENLSRGRCDRRAERASEDLAEGAGELAQGVVDRGRPSPGDEPVRPDEDRAEGSPSSPAISRNRPGATTSMMGLGRAARESVRSQYLPDRHFTAWEDVFETLVGAA
jgi:hypothetical protein